MALQGSAVRIRLAPLVGEPIKSVTKKAFGNSEQFLRVLCAVNRHRNHGLSRVVWVDRKAGLLSTYAYAIAKQNLYAEF
jgi:hypothetical protein